MDYTVALFICGLILICDKSAAFQVQDSTSPGIEDNDLTPQDGTDRELDGQTSYTQPLTLLDSVNSLGQARDPILFKLLGQAFRYRGLTDMEIADFLSDAASKLQWRQPEKRSWSRVSVQPRFATFGTKLVPNRKMENNGATLLRYGRST
uniref:Uncharacterized protein n=1 Tax=Biomphalaria glabrata TaxID=6526 RepID=A0A2C9KSN0_BIOGL